MNMTEGRPGPRVAIVGCGVSGLAAVKACLEEGLQPSCYDLKPHLGGVWFSQDSPTQGAGPQMYDSLITNTSKAMMCFSDFPCPADYPPYLPHGLYQRYLESYARHFTLLPHITFSTKVVSVEPTQDYEASGQWVVTTCPIGGQAKGQRSEVYDGVILCQGFFTSPYIPDIPGLKDRFQGQVTHVNTYRNPQPFKDKTVVVLGCASSAADVACDLAPVAKQVYLSIHRGTYVMSRLYKGLTPVDFRIRRLLFDWLPSWLMQRAMARSAAQWLNPVTSGLQPTATVPATLPSLLIHDMLPFKILTGQVKVVSAIAAVPDAGPMHLQDGQVLHDVDRVVCGTGYSHHCSTLPPATLSLHPESGRLDLYKMMFPLSLPHDSLALVGCFRANGPIPPSVELQARLAARVMSGRHRLPDRAARQRDVHHTNRQQLRDHGFYKYGFMSLAMADSVAAELGVRPQCWRLLLQGELRLAAAVMLGSALPFHYRLQGPHTWPGAREATLRAYDETVYSTQHRQVGGEGGRGVEPCVAGGGGGGGASVSSPGVLCLVKCAIWGIIFGVCVYADCSSIMV